ncbi:SusC/RagA family TonB-linked outer membrane protein [Flavobacterium aestuarii]|uniref:SusC/RagA family TonB-linked outer membrane protein n=1 Tax=Flavobacterium aestuarii TaxID=3149227 RepID=UPI0032B38B48
MKKPLSNLFHWKADTISISLIFFLLTSSFVFAQTKIQGTVKDVSGIPLPGANVTIVGTKTTVTTDFDGTFSVQAPPAASLTVSMVGFITKTVLVNGQAKISVVLKQSAEDLREVVVNVGYGTQKKKDVNSAISSIKSQDLKDSPKVTFDQMIQGKAAGVTVTNNTGQPGGDVSVKIRGTTSIGGTNEPLYIVDGIPISGDATNSSTSGRPLAAGYTGSNAASVTVSPLSLVNPNDIETMDILKDASATAIYGSRGANGVIVITTKSGKKGTGKLTYDTYFASQTQAKLLDTMTLSQFAAQQNALAVQTGRDDALRPEFAKPELLGSGTNWQKEIYQTGTLASHQLSFSGGKDGMTYYVSGGYLNQVGTVIGSGYKRYNFKTNVDAKVKEWLKIGVNVSAGISDEDITLNGSQNGIISTSILGSPDVAVKNTDGTYAGPPPSVPGRPNYNFINPVAAALLKTNNLLRKSFMGNFYSDVKLAKGLEYRFEFGGNTEISNNEEFNPTYTWGASVNEHASLTVRNQSWYSLNVKNLLTYRFALGKNNFNLLAGQEANDSHWQGNSAGVSDFLSNDITSISLGDQETLVYSDYKGSAALYSYFGRLIYDFNDKYGLNVTMRADGSSKFAEGNKWGYFPSASVSWKLSNESFMEDTKKYIDNIKIRAGYGETGNQNIGGGAYLSNINKLNTFEGNGFLAGNISNPKLQWETSTQINFGLDFTLFDSKLSSTIDLYRKKSEGFLYRLPLPMYLTGMESYQGGISAPMSNVGSMQNQGIDLTLTYSEKFGNDFSWNSTLVFSKYNNELLEITNGLNLQREATLTSNDTKTVTNTVVGEPIGQFYGLQSLGIIRTAEQLASAPIPHLGTKDEPSVLGDVLYKDQDGDGLITNKDYVSMGNPHPEFTYGFTNNFKYKSFELNIFLQGSQGNKILNLTKRAGTTNSALYQNQLEEAADFWTVDNVNAQYPRPILDAKGHANMVISDRYVEDGSYLRIQNVTFAYSLPSDIISKINLSKVRLYTGIQNLYTFTKYSGYDPEVGSLNQDALLTGVDNGRYPSPRTFTMGLNVEF